MSAQDRIAPIRKLFDEGRVHYNPDARLDLLFGMPVIGREYIPPNRAIVVSGNLHEATAAKVCVVTGLGLTT